MEVQRPAERANGSGAPVLIEIDTVRASIGAIRIGWQGISGGVPAMSAERALIADVPTPSTRSTRSLHS
jgi:hypothetical protein